MARTCKPGISCATKRLSKHWPRGISLRTPRLLVCMQRNFRNMRLTKWKPLWDNATLVWSPFCPHERHLTCSKHTDGEGYKKPKQIRITVRWVHVIWAGPSKTTRAATFKSATTTSYCTLPSSWLKHKCSKVNCWQDSYQQNHDRISLAIHFVFCISPNTAQAPRLRSSQSSCPCPPVLRFQTFSDLPSMHSRSSLRTQASEASAANWMTAWAEGRTQGRQWLSVQIRPAPSMLTTTDAV